LGPADKGLDLEYLQLMVMLRAGASSLVAAAALAALVAPALAEHCDLAVVGAGAGGAYAAWRAAFAGKSVCVFELMGRPGGRIHSLRGQGPHGDLVVEAGAYRFAPKPVTQKIGNITWLINTPLTAQIVKELRLPSAIYNPDASMWDHGMHKIVDAQGHDAGYLTVVETMLANATAYGAKVRYHTRVAGIATGDGGAVTVRLAGGGEVSAGSVLLNLPQGPLLQLLRASTAPFSTGVPRPLYAPVSFSIMKLYIHYDDAWWVNDLNLTAGPFQNTEPAGIDERSMYRGIPPQKPAALEGQYHDGDVRCDGPGGKCRGYIQAFYGNDQVPNGIQGAIKFYSVYHAAVTNDSVLRLDPSQPEHRMLLEDIHEALVELHRPALDSAGVTARVASTLPTGGVLSIWSQGTDGINAGCHFPKPGVNPKPEDVPAAALNPFSGMPVFVANEAYGHMNCFAEGSLAMADEAVRRMGVQVPGPSGAELLATDPSMILTPTDPTFIPGFRTARTTPPAGFVQETVTLSV